MNLDELRSDLERLARNYRWTWSASTRELLQTLPGAQHAVHPATVVASLSEADLGELATNLDLVERVQSEIAGLGEPVTPYIAYCSPEFGLTALLPQYAGGLGVLAGDHLKTASDLGTPLVGVGLFYHEGVFRQEIVDGRQVERYDLVDPIGVGASETGITVAVPFPGRVVAVKVWRLDIGRIPLLLLDTNIVPNSEEDRKITDRLYAGTRQHRLEQEMVLGVGGARALAETGWDIGLYHLNEGHAGFVVLELLDRVCADLGFEAARAEVRKELVFTTHTPVPAGIDRFDSATVRPYLQHWADNWSVPVESIWAMGADPDDAATFNMAAWCLRSAGKANGVSKLHGEVSRKIFAGVGIGDDIGHVTNGVHARTWTAPHTQALFDATLGEGWAEGRAGAWERVSHIDDERLIENRRRSSQVLADLIIRRTGDVIDPEALIVGFARRFAPYKRASLFLRRPDLCENLLDDNSHPVHFVFAGKAHPSDEIGKDLVAELIDAMGADFVNGRLTFIPDYEMDVAQAMVQGSDVWLNNPIRPREASGTSGQKAALNGSLNCSILDGWWAEMYDGHNGWEISESLAQDPDNRDHEEATTMLHTIASIAAEYHDSRHRFLGRIRHAWATLGPKVNSARMLRSYEEQMYR